MKIVINTCYGGYGLSCAAMMEYCRRKELKVYPEVHDKWDNIITYWLVPEGERVDIDSTKWIELSDEERIKRNKEYEKQSIHYHSIPRNDPVLVTVVEDMGSKANSRYADLTVVDIPDDVEWTIEEYDGTEWVAEKHRTWR